MFKASEQARLETVDAVDEPEVELALTLAFAIEVFAFRLERIVVPEWREVAAFAGEGRITVAICTDVHAQ